MTAFVLSHTLFDAMLLDSPIGPIEIVLSGKGIRGVLLARNKGDKHPASVAGALGQSKDIIYAAQWLNDYFLGEKKPFPWKYFDLKGRSGFELKVWRALCKIPFGQTASYRDISGEIGMPKGARAVGQANKRNPLPLFIPCHRVIASDGTIGGYSCGIGIKKALLEHEGIKR